MATRYIYRVAVQHEDGDSKAEETGNRREALDWFVEAAEAVLKPGEDLVRVALEVNGVVWGLVREPGEENKA